jgi:hypothetical protein
MLGAWYRLSPWDMEEESWSKAKFMHHTSQCRRNHGKHKTEVHGISNKSDFILNPHWSVGWVSIGSKSRGTVTDLSVFRAFLPQVETDLRTGTEMSQWSARWKQHISRETEEGLRVGWGLIRVRTGLGLGILLLEALREFSPAFSFLGHAVPPQITFHPRALQQEGATVAMPSQFSS